MSEILTKHNPIYPKNFAEFYGEVVWWDIFAPDKFNKDRFLLHLLSRGAKEMIEHAQKVFGFTDDDFREALFNAPPGVDMYEEKWEYLNKKYGIDPPLPFPRPTWVLKAIAEEEAAKKQKNKDSFHR